MRPLPPQLLNSLLELGNIDVQAFEDVHRSEEKITSIRLNPFKSARPGFDMVQVPWSKYGYYLSKRPSFTLDPLFHAGCYYVQEPGSMFLEHALLSVIDFAQNLTVLDVSAAPGGKSTLLNSLINKNSLLVSNEIIKSRADTLVMNLAKWGTNNTVVTNNEPSRFTKLPGYFDLIVVDAPCSGSGLFRKQPEAIGEWSPGHVQSCSVRQAGILKDILPALKNDGYLFYSTCSYSPEENEQMVEWLCRENEMEFVKIPVDSSWGIQESPLGYRFYPHLARTEGFFCALLKKHRGDERENRFKKQNATLPDKKEKEILKKFLGEDIGNVLKISNRFHLINEGVQNFLSVSQDNFYFKKAGTVLGEIKGNDFVPNHELALSAEHFRSLKKAEADEETALKFLRKEVLNLPDEPNGFTKICYRGEGLGWLKVLGNRSNNYLPNEWRILK